MQSIFLDFIKNNHLTESLKKEDLETLKTQSALLTVRNLKLVDLGLKISTALNRKGIKHQLLKGSMLFGLYNNFSDRTLRDVDILIDFSQIDNTISVLKDMGFFFPGRSKDNFKIKHIDGKYDLPKLINEEGLDVELHFSITGDYKTKCPLTTALLKNNYSRINMGHKIYGPTLEHNFVHILFHGISKERLGSGLFFYIRSYQNFY